MIAWGQVEAVWVSEVSIWVLRVWPQRMVLAWAVEVVYNSVGMVEVVCIVVVMEVAEVLMIVQQR